LDGLGESDRKNRLKELQGFLNWRFSNTTSHNDFFSEIQPVIDELNAIGHDLYSWDYNGEDTEIYGGDYMHLDTADKLVIEFCFPKNIKVRWEE